MSRDDERRADRDTRPTADQPSAGADKTTTTEKPERTSPGQFLREVRSELRKVAWPNRQELISYTIVVLVMSLVLTLLIWGFDTIIREAIQNTL
ncbi:MAG: preprotein translocase subunit SecE [Nitriliruptor sp.]